METIHLTAVLGEDRRLIIDLPPDTPTGPLEITINTRAEAKKPLTREEARERLRVAGLLRENLSVPDVIERLSDEEIDRLGRLKPGARPSEEIIAEGRGHE